MSKTKTKQEKPLKIVLKNKTHKHEIKIFLFNEVKQNTKFDVKQLTMLGFGLLKRNDFINFRVSLLTFEIILTYEKKPRK